MPAQPTMIKRPALAPAVANNGLFLSGTLRESRRYRFRPLKACRFYHLQTLSSGFAVIPACDPARMELLQI
jgi:hypothetical protein